MLIKEELLKINECNFEKLIKKITNNELKKDINSCKSEDKIYSWYKKHKLAKDNILKIVLYNLFRKNELLDVFKLCYKELEIKKFPDNFFKIKCSSNNPLLPIWVLSKFPICIWKDKKDFFNIDLGGHGIKSDSDIDFDIKFTKNIPLNIFNIFTNCIKTKISSTPFLFQYDTNFYLSPDLWFKPIDNYINLYYIGVLNKLNYRYLKKTKVKDSFNISKNFINNEDSKLISKFYMIQELYKHKKVTNKERNKIISIELEFYSQYIEEFKKYIELLQENSTYDKKLSEEITEQINKILLFQSESYIFPLSTIIAIDHRSIKREQFLENLSNEYKKYSYVLIALENLIDFIYNNFKAKYLLRLILALQYIVICRTRSKRVLEIESKCTSDIKNKLIVLLKTMKVENKSPNNELIKELINMLNCKCLKSIRDTLFKNDILNENKSLSIDINDVLNLMEMLKNLINENNLKKIVEEIILNIRKNNVKLTSNKKTKKKQAKETIKTKKKTI